MVGKPAFAGIAVAFALYAGTFGPARAETFVEQNAELFTTLNVALSPLELWQGAAR